MDFEIWSIKKKLGCLMGVYNNSVSRPLVPLGSRIMRLRFLPTLRSPISTITTRKYQADIYTLYEFSGSNGHV